MPSTMYIVTSHAGTASEICCVSASASDADAIARTAMAMADLEDAAASVGEEIPHRGVRVLARDWRGRVRVRAEWLKHPGAASWVNFSA